MVCGAGTRLLNDELSRLKRGGNSVVGGLQNMGGGETMFEFGFNASDVRRIAWTFFMAAGAVFTALAAKWFEDGGDLNWKAWAVAALAAGISAVKNGSLSDTSNLK
jgi:hypothetical protein